MTNDDKFEEALTAMARDHNRPAAVPREEMWAVIAAARAAEREKQSAATPAPVVIPMRPPRTVWRWTAAGSALAVTLLLGIVIGRRSRDDSAKPNGASGTVATLTGETTRLAGTTRSGGDSLATPRTADNAGAEGGSGTGGPRRAIGRSSPSTVVASARNGVTRGESSAATTRERDAALPYRVATLQHLATTEALLVSLRSDARAGRSDTTIAGWAGQLLGTTRMLIDSPASRDPQMKQLLQDLELVLAQIARLPEAHGQAADLGLIDDAVQRRQIMTRLRALTPTT